MISAWIHPLRIVSVRGLLISYFIGKELYHFEETHQLAHCWSLHKVHKLGPDTSRELQSATHRQPYKGWANGRFYRLSTIYGFHRWSSQVADEKAIFTFIFEGKTGAAARAKKSFGPRAMGTTRAPMNYSLRSRETSGAREPTAHRRLGKPGAPGGKLSGELCTVPTIDDR